jgi:hypothetical protein
MIAGMSRIASDLSMDLVIHDLGYPDVICVLPDEAVQATLDHKHPRRSTRFPGWPTLLADYNAAVARSHGKGGKPELKQFVLRRLGLKMDVDSFVADVLANASKPLSSTSPLAEIMSRVLTRASRD